MDRWFWPAREASLVLAVVMATPARAVFVVSRVIEFIELGGGSGDPLAGRLRRSGDLIQRDKALNQSNLSHCIGDSMLLGDGGPASAEPRWQVPGRRRPPSSA